MEEIWVTPMGHGSRLWDPCIIDDVEKLDAIQDVFIHFQLIRFCQATRLQHINSHIMLNNRCVLQQQYVDCKIVDAFLKKGTK